MTNSDVFMWALYELGGSDEFIDVEDVYLAAFKLAPQRFSWRTKPDIPDRLKGGMALHTIDVKTPKLLIKKGPDQRRLTLEGQRWIEEHFDRLAGAFKGDRIVEPPKGRRSSRLISDAMKSDAVVRWQDSGSLPEEKWIFADLLRCSPDSAHSIWSSRLETLRSAAYAAGREDLLSFLEVLTSEHKDWF